MRIELLDIGIVGVIEILCGVAVIVLAVIKGIRISSSENLKKIGLIGIWLLGILSALFGFLERTLQMIEVFDTIAEVGNFSASLIAEGVSRTSSFTTIGLLILILSLILWGFLKGMINLRDRKLNL